MTALLAETASVLPPAVAVPVPDDTPTVAFTTVNCVAEAVAIVMPAMLSVVPDAVIRPVTETVLPAVNVLIAV